jgi:hypothetical protein
MRALTRRDAPSTDPSPTLIQQTTARTAASDDWLELAQRLDLIDHPFENRHFEPGSLQRGHIAYYQDPITVPNQDCPLEVVPEVL